MLCLSGFELYSCWVPLFQHIPDSIKDNSALGNSCLAVTPANHCSEFRMPKYPGTFHFLSAPPCNLCQALS